MHKKLKGCVACKKKVEPVSETLGQCVKCSTFQRLDKCADDVSIKLLIESDGHRYNLHAYLPVIRHIVDDEGLSADSKEETIIEALLTATPFTAVFNAVNNITDMFGPQ